MLRNFSELQNYTVLISIKILWTDCVTDFYIRHYNLHLKHIPNSPQSEKTNGFFYQEVFTGLSCVHCNHAPR